MKEIIFIMMLRNQYIVFFNGKRIFSPQLTGHRKTTHARTIGWFDSIYHHWFCYEVSDTSVLRIDEKIVWKGWEWDACIMRYNKRHLWSRPNRRAIRWGSWGEVQKTNVYNIYWYSSIRCWVCDSNLSTLFTSTSDQFSPN